MGFLAAVAVTVATGCGSGTPERDSEPSARAAVAAAPVAVTRNERSMPAGCRPGQVARLVIEFFERFNRGDPAAASSFALNSTPTGGLLDGPGRAATSANWYSVTEGTPRQGGRHFVARDTGTLAQHVTDRHDHRERLLLREIRVRYEPGGLGHVEYRLNRRADDLDALDIRTKRMSGKGAIDCAKRKIVAWSMGVPTGPVPDGYLSTPLCPPPTTRSTSPIACAV